MLKVKLFVILFLIVWLSACQTAVSETPTAAVTVQPTVGTVQPTVFSSQSTVTSSQPTQVSSPTPQPPSPPTPTAQPPDPLKIQVDTAVPLELQTAVESIVAANPEQFVFAEGESALQLTINTETPIANWIFAVAAPFPTFADNISLDDIQRAWQDGALMLTAEMEAILQTWWGVPAIPATIVAPEVLIETLWQTQTAYDDPQLTILPFEQLDPRLKVLAVEGNSPISVEYDQESYALSLPWGWVGEDTAVSQIQSLWQEEVRTNRNDDQITHVTMTGPSGLSRAVADRMEKYGYQYPGEVIAPILRSADIAHMSHENPFAPDCPPPETTGGTKFCAQPKTVELMTWMGVDVVELTGNHLNDWGTQNLSFTLDLYDELGFETYGGGRNLEDAGKPLLMEHNGNKIAFVGCNPVGPYGVWATEDKPGALPCNDYSFNIAQIEELAAEGYVVLSSIQFVEHYQYDAYQPQRNAFMGFADAGASVVHGSQGHFPMGFAFSEDRFVHYGTGNTFADQMFSLGTRQMFINTYVIYNGRLLSTELWTGMVEDYARPRLMTAEERRQLLQSVFDGSDFALGE